MAGYIGSKASVVSSGAERKKTFTITGATTSLTGLNYTVGKVHVFQNGVRLVDGTDYTATNGTTITLTVAAQNGDNVVVISQASYQVALSGIDDQSNATAITIDSSENVMIGTTDSSLFNNTTGGGFMSASTGRTDMAREANVVATMNRTGNSDGDILEFRKDGAVVGRIGTASSTTYIAGDASGIRLGSTAFMPSTTLGANKDASVDLGHSAVRFKDAYLSGGVYLGGTVGANKLEDYEEGSWTPSLVGYSGTPTIQQSYYTKIGRLVFATCRVGLDGTSDGSTFVINNLPFTCYNTASSIFGTNIVYSNSTTAPTYSLVAAGTTQINFYNASGGTISYTSAGVNKDYRINITYFTT